jgi:undecaprenyl-diphosphatase
MGTQNDAATTFAVRIGFGTIEICGDGANRGKFPRFFVASQAPLRQKRSPASFLAASAAIPSEKFMDLVAIKTAMLASAVAHIDLIKAAALGIVEGLTEYLPVSSTGHLLLMEHLFGWGDDAFGKSFAVLIQLGAILALLSIYFGRLWALAKEMFTQWAAARFVIGILLAFLPAAVIGALGYHIIKSYLFDVRIVCVSLIIGGFVLLWVDRLNLQARYHEANAFSLPMYFGIGIIQCISMIPGVSRAGATIVGAMLFGADRRSAAEFSFWLAMPTMVGAFAYEVYKSRGELALGGNITVTAVGFVFSFIFGWIVVKTFLRYVQRHSFALFAWWRILVGGAGLVALYVF